MRTIRRLYLYAVSLVGIEAAVWGVIGLARAAFAHGEIGGGANRLAGAISAIVVAVPVFFFHWRAAQKSAIEDNEERTSGIRAVFLYGTVAAFCVPVLSNTIALITRLLHLAFGMDSWRALLGGSQTWSDNIIAMVLNLIMAGYFGRTLQVDWNQGAPGEAFETTRRLYRYFGMIIGLVASVVGIKLLVQFSIDNLEILGIGNQSLLANGLALIIVGPPVWWMFTRMIEPTLRMPQEINSMIHWTVLYLVNFISLGILLVSAGVVTDVCLRTVLGEKMRTLSFLTAISRPLSIAIPMGLVWVYYTNILKGNLTLQEDQIYQSGLRRFYSYVLSFVGLAATFIGTQMAFSFLINAALGGSTAWGDVLRTQISASLSTILIGLPVWIYTWRPITAEALSENESGDHARRSVLRKVYLYLAMFVGMLGVMFSGGAVIFQIIISILGEPPENPAQTTVELVKVLVLFAALLVYHWKEIKRDNSISERFLAGLHAAFPVLLLAEQGESFLDKIQQALGKTVPTLPIHVHTDLTVPPDATLTQQVKAMVMPGTLAVNLHSDLAKWIQRYHGQRLVVPEPVERWTWVAEQNKGGPTLYQQGAEIIRRLAEGQKDTPRLRFTIWQVIAFIALGVVTLSIFGNVTSSMLR